MTELRYKFDQCAFKATSLTMTLRASHKNLK